MQATYNKITIEYCPVISLFIHCLFQVETLIALTEITVGNIKYYLIDLCKRNNVVHEVIMLHRSYDPDARFV